MIRVCIILQAAVLAAFGAGPPLGSFFRPFDGKDSQVTWEAPTNFPSSVKTFAVVPTKFSPETISNLLELAGLTPQNKRRPVQQGVFLGKDVQTYANRDDSQHVDIVPSQGFLALNRDGVFAALPKQKPVGVPNDQQAAALAVKLAENLGLNPSELKAHDGQPLPVDVSEGMVLQKDKASGRLVTNIISRTVGINRRIEGIPVAGMAGISMKFGNEGKLASLSWVWRSIKPAGVCAVPSAAEFISRIKSGRAFIHPEHEGKPLPKLAIKQVQLYYWENEGSNPQKMIYPYAILKAENRQSNVTSALEIFVPFAAE